MDDQLRVLYALFNPGAPLAADADDLYVDLDPARGGARVVSKLEQRIRLVDSGISCQLLSGHMGCGKSTELRRLQARLTKGEPKFFTVLVKALEETDVYDLDFPELLIAVVRGIARELKSEAKILLKPGPFAERIRKATELFLGPVEIEKVELDAFLGSVSLAIKGSSEARRRIREALEPDTSNLLAAANEKIGEGVQALSKKGYAGMVVIVDGLDRVPTTLFPDEKFNRAENLFVERYGQMTGFMCHMVYTLPLPLAYSTAESQIATRYGGRPPVIPMVKIKTRPPKRNRDAEGHGLMIELVEKRIAKAGMTPADVFDDRALLDEIVRVSGGQPRELMMLMREAIIGDGIPIKRPAIERAAREGTRAYARQLREEHWSMLQQVAKTGDLKRSKQNDELIRDLLESRAVLQYVNEVEWYDVNPLIELPKAAKRRKTAPAKPKTRKATARRKK